MHMSHNKHSKTLAIVIIVIPNVTVEVKEPEKQHTAETFKTRKVYEDSESHKETKNKFFLIIKRKNISKLMARLDLGKFLGRSLAFSLPGALLLCEHEAFFAATA